MSVDFTKPVATADRAQNLTDTKDTLVAVAKQLDDTTPTGVATGMIRWSSANSKWQKYNGTSWVDLAATFSMNVSSLGGQAAANYLLKSGGTLTGFLTLHAAPTADMHAATKKYADDKVNALNAVSGTWTPTLTPFLNVDAVYHNTSRYIRVGAVVQFEIYMSIDVTAANVITSVLVTNLPAASDFTLSSDAVGSAVIYNAGGGQVTAEPSNNGLLVTFHPPSTSLAEVRASGMYVIK